MALTIIERNVQLDVYDHDLTPSKIKAIALDSKTRYVGAEIHNGGQIYDVGQNTGVTLTIIRPDKTGVQITGETFQYTVGEGETVYGAYAELTQTALAVSGTLQAQFMFTSGEQILRSEIFTINNGVALDSTVSEWAGEYQGYNLDELVQNVNETVAKVDAMEDDVSDLKSDIRAVNTNTNLVKNGLANPTYVEQVVSPTVVTGQRIYMNSEHTAIGTVADANGAYLTQSVSEGETYHFSGRFTVYISGIFLLNGSTLISYKHYNTVTENVVDYEIPIPSGCDTLKITYSTGITATLKKNVLNGYELKKSGVLNNYIFNKTAMIFVSPTITVGKRLYMNDGHTAVGEIDDANGAYLTQSVSGGEKYYFTGRQTIYISGIFLFKGGTLISYDHYNTSTENVEDYEIDVPIRCDTLKITYSTAQPMTLKKLYSEDVLKLGSASNYWTVGPDGFGDFTTISDACEAANNGDTIVVYPAVYREQINIYGKELHIRGIDKQTCILIDSSSDYRTPPLMANWGSISNMTIIEDAANPDPAIDDVIYDGHPVKNMAYCIHSDSADGIWTTEETAFIVEDCILKNANRPCIGAGLYPNHSLIVRNCVLESGAGVVSGFKRGALYAHNNTSKSGVMNQKIIFEGNRIRCNDDVVVVLYATDGTGTCDVELMNNNVYSSVDGVTTSIVRNDATPSNAKFKLLESCFGNNISTMNYPTA